MPRQARDVRASLIKKFGFSPAQHKSTDHEWLKLDLPGSERVLTKFSHGEREIRDRLLGIIARQLKVGLPYLGGMIDCRNSREDYYQHLQSLGREDCDP